MNKPFSMLYEEFRQGVTDLINNSGLPPFVIESILKNYTNEVSGIAKNQYQVDKMQYEKLLLEEKERKEEVKNTD